MARKKARRVVLMRTYELDELRLMRDGHDDRLILASPDEFDIESDVVDLPYYGIADDSPFKTTDLHDLLLEGAKVRIVIEEVRD